MSFDLVLFGGTGDLTWRKLMPSLFQAWRHGKLPSGGRILAVARDDRDDASYRTWLHERLQAAESAKRPTEDEYTQFAQRVHYLRMDLSQAADYARLSAWLGTRPATQPGLEERRAEEGVMHMPVRSALFAGNYVIEPKAWETRPDMLAADLPINLLNPGVYASYVEGLEGAYAYLDQQVPDRSLSVYALDFPAYVFSVMGGYRVPRHSYPWMLFDHEITMDHHPDAETLLSDVDVLMVPKCSLSGGNRKWLHAIYRVHIEAHWKREASVRCWDVYRRRPGP